MLKVNREKKTISYCNLTADETVQFNALVLAGYVPHIKSEKRAAKAKARATKDNLNNETILAALKDDKEGLKKYTEIKKTKGKNGGFFAAKQWYKDTYNK